MVTTDLKATERPKNTASIRTYLTSVHEVKPKTRILPNPAHHYLVAYMTNISSKKFLTTHVVAYLDYWFLHAPTL